MQQGAAVAVQTGYESVPIPHHMDFLQNIICFIFYGTFAIRDEREFIIAILISD